MSTKTLIIAAAALGAGALTTLPTAAAEGETQARQLPMRAQVLFNLVDANGDGFIDQTEIVALQNAIFASIDTDGDGKLSKEEFAKMSVGPRGARHGQMMGRMGPGGGDQGPGFHRGQRGGDHGPGLHRGQRGERGERQGQMQPQDFNQGPGGRGPGEPRFGQADTDAPDGVPGFPGLQGRDFASLDINGDGVISIDEFTVGGPRLPNPTE